MNEEFNESTYARAMPTPAHEEPRIAFVMSHIPATGARILDLGCWDGAYAARYKRAGNYVAGIESSPTAARMARERGVDARVGNVMETHHFDERFDIVVAGEIIEHVFDTDDFIKIVSSYLKPGGLLVVTTPNVASLPRRLLLLLGINPYLENRVIQGVSVGHIRYFTFIELTQLLRDRQLEIVDEQTDILNVSSSGRFCISSVPHLFRRIGRTICVAARLQASS